METPNSREDIGARAKTGARYARERYLPKPATSRHGVSLCLSGGGFRAALFHLGALRRLNELGVLGRIDQIASVSGGSIFAAHLATTLSPWPSDGAIAPDWEERVAYPFRAFAARNLRTRPLLRWLTLPWRWSRTSGPIEDIALRFERDLSPLRLRNLPYRPRYLLCATDMTYGCNWEFSRGHIGDYRVHQRRPSSDWSLGRAVAASCCFPPVFDAMRLAVDHKRVAYGDEARTLREQHCAQDIQLTDGGVYDNLGLEPVWKTARTVLVSDGGGVFRRESSKNLVARVLRYPAIMGNQVDSLRKRWLIESFLEGEMEGTYWGIGSTAAHYHPGAYGYAAQEVNELISTIRTDLDAFSMAEAAVLENHGYCLAEAAIQQHASALIATHAAPFDPPHPEWMDDKRVRRALRGSQTRTLLGRGWWRALIT